MNAIEFLENQHRKVEGLFDDIENDNVNKNQLINELANNIIGHMIIEEKIFYPFVRENAKEELEDQVLESKEEHATARWVLEQLLSTKPESEEENLVSARLHVLMDLISHHVEEEESSIFPIIRKRCENSVLEDLGNDLEKLFEEALETGYESILKASKK